MCIVRTGSSTQKFAKDWKGAEREWKKVCAVRIAFQDATRFQALLLTKGTNLQQNVTTLEARPNRLSNILPH